MNKKHLLYAILSLFLLAGSMAAWADPQEQSSYFSLQLSPAVDIPLGGSAALFGPSGGGTFSAEFRMPFLPAVSLDAGLGYTFYSMLNAAAAQQSLSMFSASGGLGLQFPLSPAIGVKGFFNGGYSYGFSNDFSRFQSGGSAFLETGAKVFLDLGPTFSLGLGVSYRYFFGLFQGIEIALGTGFRFPSTQAARAPVEQAPSVVRPEPLVEETTGLELQELSFSEIFPVFHKYYDDHPVGTAVLYNGASVPATNIKVTLEIKPYMTAPKTCMAPQELQPGDSGQVELTALFSEKEILQVTEGTKASAEINWEYAVNGQKRSGKTVETVRILNRNVMTWEDDRRAAAFITSLDPAVLTFSKNVSGMVKAKSGGAVNPNLLTAIALYEALCQYGMAYSVDPKKIPYADRSQDATAVDFLQFPQQTLEYKSGDCDDLTILFCALFESISIDTAFITVPGHIYMAFSLGTTPEEARKSFQVPDDLVYQADKAWVPIEVTMLDGKFLEAWQAGAKEWREADARQLAAFYPTHDAWQIYEAVGLVSGSFQLAVPAKDAVVAAYQKEVERFVNREIYPEISRLQAEIQKTQKSAKAVNKLGVLYARYGLTSLAERQFLDVISREEYEPALVNLGNLAYMQKDLKKAQGYYERAARKAPDDPKALLCLARVYHDTENYGLVKEAYDRLKNLDPDLAQQFSYLDMKGEEATRAADVTGVREVMVWGEE